MCAFVRFLCHHLHKTAKDTATLTAAYLAVSLCELGLGYPEQGFAIWALGVHSTHYADLRMCSKSQIYRNYELKLKTGGYTTFRALGEYQ
jgi:hypothetical protein